MQPRPTASEILSTVAQVLEEQIVPALNGQVQHNARVAANLVQIVERELRLSPDADERECAALVALLGTEGDLDVASLRARFAADLRAGLADSPERATEIWPVLMAGVRDDLAVVKPGHDSWDGA
jgi:hypothetical protein